MIAARGAGVTRVGPHVTFVTHVAEPSGAELCLLNTFRTQGFDDCRILFLADGPLVAQCRTLGIEAEVMPILGRTSGIRRETGALAAAWQAGTVVRHLLQLAAKLRTSDVVVACSQKAFVFCAPAAAWARRPMVWCLNDILSAEHFSKGLRHGVANLANVLATRVIVNSAESHEAFVAAGGSRRRLSIIEPGIDIARFARPTPLDAPVPDRACPVRIVNVARIAPWKGQDVLLRALADVPDVEAWFVGAPLFDEVPYCDALHAEARRLGVQDRVHWLGHRDDVAALLQRADVFVHAATAAEPFGQTVVEAMAAGLPVIVPDIGAPPRVVGGEAGLVFRTGSSESLGGCIRRLAEDPEERQRMGDVGRRRAERWSIDRDSSALRTCVDEVAGRVHPKDWRNTSETLEVEA